MNGAFRKRYKNPKSSASFGGISKQYGLHKKSIKVQQVRKGLQGVKSYTLHRERKSPRTRNPFFIFVKRQQIQIDLIEIRDLAQYNDGIKFLFTSIDMFSKYGFCFPMTDKSANSAKHALEEMMKFYGTKPKEILSDNGTEFKNKIVSKYLTDLDINQRFTMSDIKCAGIERFNKTLQGKIYRYLTENNTFRYLDILKDILDSYNQTEHRTIKLTPSNAENERFGEFVRGNLAEFYFQRNSKKPKFKIGEHVRISKSKQTFDRSYSKMQNFEVFEIHSINSNLPIPMYILKSLYHDDVLGGGFYEDEIVKIDCLRIKTLKKSQNGKDVFVEWLEDPELKKSWIPVKHLNNLCIED